MKTVAVIQARLGSTRLPGKVLMELGGQPVLKWSVDACRNAIGVDSVVVATTTEDRDLEIYHWCMDHGVYCIRGPELDVIKRFVLVQKATNADILLRLTGDCPFLDSRVISDVVRLRKIADAHYASNIDPPTFPDGLDTECFTAGALYIADENSTRPSDRDCVTQYMQRNKYIFKHANLTCAMPGLHSERWVLDTENDLSFCREIANRLVGTVPSYQSILAILDREPHLRDINKHHPRNERFYESLVGEEPIKRVFVNSKELLSRAEEVIPLASQTFSKSKVQYPETAPLFVTHGDGGRIFDVDGNDFVDLVGALLPNILGYRDPDVDYAIRTQLDRGISLSLATELESQLAERLITLIPSAEMVRFGKTGSDATSAAIRLARAYTGRDTVLSAGYHGWHDWTVAGDKMRGKGTTYGADQDTLHFEYGQDIVSKFGELDKIDAAAVIVEPETNQNYLMWLKGQCDKYGTVLIFDEIITWPRWGLTGAQGLFGVTPDLTTISKALANGMPISAVMGRKDIMRLMEPPDNIFYSGTFFGETLSLAAACIAVDKLVKYNVPTKLAEASWNLGKRVDELGFDRRDVCMHLEDDSPLTRLVFSNQDVATLFRQEMIANGVLIIGSHNLCYAHSDSDMQRVVNAYERTLAVLSEANKRGDIRSRIKGASISATANVRAVG